MGVSYSWTGLNTDWTLLVQDGLSDQRTEQQQQASVQRSRFESGTFPYNTHALHFNYKMLHGSCIKENNIKTVFKKRFDHVLP